MINPFSNMTCKECSQKITILNIHFIGDEPICDKCFELFELNECTCDHTDAMGNYENKDCEVHEYIDAEDDSGFVTCNGKGERI